MSNYFKSWPAIKNIISTQTTAKYQQHLQSARINNIHLRMSSMQTYHSTETDDERNLATTRTCDTDCSRPGYY